MPAFLKLSPRDVLLSDTLSVERQEAAQAFVESLKNILATMPFSHVEEELNLALYYWHHAENRSYDFYLIERFFQLRNITVNFNDSDGIYCTLGFGQGGVLIQPRALEFEARPFILAQPSRLYDIYSDTGGGPQPQSTSQSTLHTLHGLQQEIFFLVDSWEYLNSILGIEHETNQKGLPQDLALHSIRGARARWCLDVLADVQEWLNSLRASTLWNTDVRTEAEALATLMLGTTQKLYLPASMSRIPYPHSVLEGFKRFAQARLVWSPQDMSSRLVLGAFALVGKDFSNNFLGGGSGLDPTLWDVLDIKPHTWRFCYDPFLAIKAFAWMYPPWEYEALLFLTGFCFYQKNFSERLDTNILWEWAEGFSMQKDFADVRQDLGGYPESAVGPPSVESVESVMGQSMGQEYVRDSAFEQQGKQLTIKLENFLGRQDEVSQTSHQCVQDLLVKLKKWNGD
jgi:hypothetical protein